MLIHLVQKSSPETIEGTPRALESVDDIERGDGFTGRGMSYEYEVL
jgi:hypothetical protein